MASAEDPVLPLLMETISKGWPKNKDAVSDCLIPYFYHRDEMSVQDGIALRGERIIIPSKLRDELKSKLHAGHLGINSCLRRARELVYWPRMSSEIRQYVESCDVCATYPDKQPAGTINFHDVPNRPWEKVGSDLFTFQDRAYLITVDYYSSFFELDYLRDTLSETVISKLKSHLLRMEVHSTHLSLSGDSPENGTLPINSPALATPKQMVQQKRL